MEKRHATGPYVRYNLRARARIRAQANRAIEPVLLSKEKGKAFNCSSIRRLDHLSGSKRPRGLPLGVQKFVHGNKTCVITPEPC